MFFAYRSFYTQAPLCTGACRHNNLHTEMLLHKENPTRKNAVQTGVFIYEFWFTYRCVYLYRDFCAQAPLHTHTRAFRHTHRHTHTNTHTHLCVYRQKLLHTGASAQKLLHTEAITHRCYFTHQLLRFACAHKRFNRQKTLIHTCVLTHRSDDTACAHSRLVNFTHRKFRHKFRTRESHMCLMISRIDAAGVQEGRIP